jgi:hypothetical protein
LIVVDVTGGIVRGDGADLRWDRTACTRDATRERVGNAADDAPGQLGGLSDHLHDSSVEDANQEEVYIPIKGSGVLHADGEVFALRPGMMARVGPEQLRRIVPGEEGIQFIALGGVPGSFEPSAWSELGGPLPVPRDAG